MPAPYDIVDILLEKGLVALLCFTPLAFGAVQIWALAVTEIVAFSLLFLFLLRKALRLPSSGTEPPRSRAGGFHNLLLWLGVLFGLMILLALFQMIPLPQAFLKVLSPASLATYLDFGDSTAGAFHPISLYPDATRREIQYFLANAAVFCVIVGQYRTRAQLISLLHTLLFVAGLLIVLALIQKMTWEGRILWFYPVAEYLKSGGNIWGPYVNRDHFAGYLEMVIPLGIGLLLYRLPRIPALPGTPWRVRLARFLAAETLTSCSLLFILVLVMTAVLFATFSRGGILACVGSLVLMALLSRQRHSLRRRALPLAALGLTIFVCIVFSSWDRLEDRFSALEQDHVSRLDVWRDAIGIVRDYPVFGTGLGTFKSAFMRYQRSMPRSLFDHAHNDYLELATDTGIVGFLLGIGMVAVFIGNVMRRWRKKHGMFGKCIALGGMGSLGAIAVHSFVDFNLHIPANGLLFTVVCAATCVAAYRISDQNGRSSEASTKDGSRTDPVGIRS